MPYHRWITLEQQFARLALCYFISDNCLCDSSRVTTVAAGNVPVHDHRSTLLLLVMVLFGLLMYGRRLSV